MRRKLKLSTTKLLKFAMIAIGLSIGVRLGFTIFNRNKFTVNKYYHKAVDAYMEKPQ